MSIGYTLPDEAVDVTCFLIYKIVTERSLPPLPLRAIVHQIKKKERIEEFIMELSPRPSSSVYSNDTEQRVVSSAYSDSFDLDNLLHRISLQTTQQQDYTIQALEREQATMRLDRSAEGKKFTALYRAMLRASEATIQLDGIRRQIEQVVQKQSNIWLANCTAI